jgi:uncharacterized protein YggE
MRSTRVFVAAGASLAATMLLATPSRAAVERPFPVVTVTGEANSNVASDLAHATAGVNSDAKTPREAAEANAAAMNGIIAALRQAGIPDSDTRTVRFSIVPLYAQRPSEGQSQIIGYRVSNQVRVTVRDVTKVGDILDRLTSAGATNLIGLEFGAADPGSLLDDARTAAFADAKRKAELFARAAGAQVGRAVSISEDDARAPRRFSRSFSLAQEASATTPITPGEETMRVRVTVSFELNN